MSKNKKMELMNNRNDEILSAPNDGHFAWRSWAKDEKQNKKT